MPTEVTTPISYQLMTALALDGGEDRHQPTDTGEHAEQPQELPLAARLPVISMTERLFGPGVVWVDYRNPPTSAETRPSIIRLSRDGLYSGGNW